MENRVFWMKYWRRGLWLAWLLRMTPYIRMVGLNGSMLRSDFNLKSDIDLFIVTKKKRIYTAKAFAGLVAYLTGFKRHGDMITGRFCLNRYSTEDWLFIGPANEYHARTFHNIIPLYANDRIYEQYLAINDWMGDFGYPVSRRQIVLRDSGVVWVWRTIWEYILWWPTGVLEGILKMRQIRVVRKDPRCNHPKSIVVLSNHELRFHLYKGEIF